MLQLLPQRSGHVNGNWNLATDSKFQSMIKNIDDFTSMNEIIKEICNVRGLGCERRYKRHIYIDNRKLDGFIKFFKDGHCTGNCLSCNYCKTIADKVIVKNDEICNYLEQLYDKFNEAKF